jgi:exosortase E/protease (VPEID-CTERM system)
MAMAHGTVWLRAQTGRVVVAQDPALRLAAALLIPFAALMAARIVGSVFGDDPNWASVVAVALPAVALVTYRRAISTQLSRIGVEPILLGLAVGALWIVTQRVSAEGVHLERWLTAQPPLAAGAWVVLRILAFALVVPIAEELVFRGYLHRALIARRFETVSPNTFTWLAFIATSVLFGAMHGRWLSGALAGVVFAIALYRSKSLTGPIAAHIAANGLIALYAVTAERWDLL